MRRLDPGSDPLERDAELAASRAARNVGPRADRPAAEDGAKVDSSPDRLPEAERAHFERHFGHDFGDVRVHHDARSAERAEALAARAYTIGADIHFGRGEYAPETPSGRRLLAHELAHVVHQRVRPGVGLQRQVIPQELKQSVDVSKLSDEALQERHDTIIDVLRQFTVSTFDTMALELEAANLGTELARREATRAGRVFDDDAIKGMRDYFRQNARTEKDSCIVCLNKGMKLVTGKEALPTTPKSIEATMAKIAEAGHSGEAREIWFQGRNGKITRGGSRPVKLNESVWDAVVAMSGGDPGWSVFTLSLLDGYHSVTLTLDANDPGRPRIYWSDQWRSKGGWKEYKRSSLDAEIVKLVQGWWDKQAEGKKHTTVVRLWRMRATKAVP